MAHEYGVRLRTQLVDEHLRGRGGERHGAEMVVYVAVAALCPLQHYVRTVQRVDGHEPLVEPSALRLQHSHAHLYARLTQLGYAPSADTRERIDTPHHHSPHALAHYEIGAWGSLAVVGARLKAHVHGRLRQQMLVGRAHGGEGVDLGMPLAAAHVVALAYDAAAAHYHRTHHGVGLGVLTAVGGKLQAACHVLFVC